MRHCESFTRLLRKTESWAPPKTGQGADSYWVGLAPKPPIRGPPPSRLWHRRNVAPIALDRAGRQSVTRGLKPAETRCGLPSPTTSSPRTPSTSKHHPVHLETPRDARCASRHRPTPLNPSLRQGQVATHSVFDPAHLLLRLCGESRSPPSAVARLIQPVLCSLLGRFGLLHPPSIACLHEIPTTDCRLHNRRRRLLRLVPSSWRPKGPTSSRLVRMWGTN